MRGIKLAAVVLGGVVAGLMIPATSAGATPPGSGASVVFDQFGVATHNICVNAPFELVASGFAANRHSVEWRVVTVGYGPQFGGTIPLSSGAGTIEMPPGDDTAVGLKIRIRYQTGSSAHPANLGSVSGTFVECA